MSTTPTAAVETANQPVTALGLKKAVQDLESRIKEFADLATVEQYQLVCAIGLDAARTEKEAVEFYEPECKRLHQLWKDKTTERASIVDPAQAVKNRAGLLAGQWQSAQEQKRLQAEREEQERQLKLAEDAQVEEARLLEKEGRHEDAEAVISMQPAVAPVNVQTTVPKVSGVSKPRDNFQAQVTSLQLLVKAVAEGKVPLKAIEANMSFLNSMAKALKEELKYPGVKVTNAAKSAFRG